jgi:hypothetical protein
MPPLCAAIARYLAFLWPGRHIVSLSFVRKPDHDDREHHLSRRAAIDESRFAVFSQDGRIHWQQHACIRSQPQNRSIHAARRFGPTGSGDSLRTSGGAPRLRLAIANLMGGMARVEPDACRHRMSEATSISYSAAARTCRALGVRMVTSSSAAVGCTAMVASKSALVAFILIAIPST